MGLAPGSYFLATYYVSVCWYLRVDLACWHVEIPDTYKVRCLNPRRLLTLRNRAPHKRSTNDCADDVHAGINNRAARSFLYLHFRSDRVRVCVPTGSPWVSSYK